MAGNIRNHIISRIIGHVGIIVVTMLFLFGGFDSSSAGESGKGGKYPSRPIKIIVPAAAGGSLGNEIRAITPYVEKNLGVSTVIEYVTGADGLIAYNKIYQEKPDGHTIIYYNLISALALEVTRETAKYSVKNYTPVCGWNVKYQALLVHPETWKTFGEFLSEAKKRPLSLAGTGGHTIINVNVLESALGVKFNLVPFKSSGEGIAAVAGKHVDCLLTYETTPKPMIQAGKLRALAVLSSKPDPILPGVPDLKELGHPEVFIIPAYGNISAPPNTPKEAVAVLEKAFSKAVAVPEFLKIAENIGMYVDFIPSAGLRKATNEQFDIVNKYKQFIK